MYYTNLNSPNQTYDANHPILHFIKTNFLRLIIGFIVVLLFMEYASYIYVYTNNVNQNLTPNFLIKNEDFFFESKFKLIDEFGSANSGRKISFNDDPSIKDINSNQSTVNSSQTSLPTCPLIPPHLSELFLKIFEIKKF